MIAASCVLLAVAVAFAGLVKFGQYLERHPEKSEMGKRLQREYERTTRDSVGPLVERMFTEAWAAHYVDASTAARPVIGEADSPAVDWWHHAAGRGNK